MVFLKIGDQGPAVAQSQQLLNDAPSKLPPLKRDGIFGAKTQARVVEFQKDNGLKPDGIVGHLTITKLQALRDAYLQKAMADIAYLLDDPAQQQYFLMQARALIPPRNPNLIGTTLVEGGAVILLLIILLFMVLLLQSSHRKADQEMAKEWNRRFQRLKESIRGKPVEVQTAETYEEAKQRGRDVAKRVREDLDKCLENLDPARAQKCAGVIKVLTTAIQSLLQKIITRLGGGIKPENVAKGIAESIKAVFEAAKAVSECTGCDI
jgi:hypothetical protein